MLPLKTSQKYFRLHIRTQQTFVQGIIWVWLKEEVLQSNHHRVEIQDRLPVLSKNV